MLFCNEFHFNCKKTFNGHRCIFYERGGMKKVNNNLFFDPVARVFVHGNIETIETITKR